MSKRIILVLGATGTQGGAVANDLLKYPEQYTTRCLTRNPDSDKAKALAALGAEIVQADLIKPVTLPAAFKGVWGCFAVTDFYDTAVLEDPMSEEKQGKNIVDAAAKAGKSSVDAVIREAGLSGAFIRTGNFYENMILRKYAAYDKEADVITMARPIITADAEITTLYVEKDLAAVCKAIFDQWEDKKSSLDGKYFLASGARETQGQINEVLERVSGKKVVFTTKPTTGIKDRDIMLQLYNAVGMYPGVTVPSPDVLDLGIKLHTCEDYIRERLLPHLGLKAIA
ncbi:NAD(P)-binding protein [Cadophora sp. DSE1049]|nr:NAD(P)-binding protein [Cadophora sp. DSE1049]